MLANKPDFEIRIKGHPLIKIKDGEARVDGRDYHTDLKNISTLVDMLQDIICSAQDAGRPRVVTSDGKRRQS